VSGKNLFSLAQELEIKEEDFRKACYRNLFGIDQGIVVYFKSPNSFTGEDVLEFHVHGSDRICELLLEEFKKRNILEALPGEFSFRSFMNEKMTLSEAEALHTALSAASESPLSKDLLNLSKNTQEKTLKIFSDLESSLTSARGRLESAIDFSEATDEQEQDVLSCQEKLTHLSRRLDEFLTNYQNFSSSWEKPKVLIVGEPNSGKSSLLNLLLGSERSLVSDVPGTTRDYIEARVKISHQEFIFVDTAGLRGLEGEKIDIIESKGIDRAISLLNDAQFVIWVQPSHKEKNKNIEKLLSNHSSVLLLESFSDISQKKDAFNFQKDSSLIRQKLEKELLPLLSYKKDHQKLDVFLSHRQVLLLKEVESSVKRAILSLHKNRSLELVAEDLILADKALKNCQGRDLSEDYISEIFSQFCLGK
jgi:tRNA modification GTPase